MFVGSATRQVAQTGVVRGEVRKELEIDLGLMKLANKWKGEGEERIKTDSQIFGLSSWVKVVLSFETIRTGRTRFGGIWETI